MILIYWVCSVFFFFFTKLSAVVIQGILFGSITAPIYRIACVQPLFQFIWERSAVSMPSKRCSLAPCDLSARPVPR